MYDEPSGVEGTRSAHPWSELPCAKEMWEIQIQAPRNHVGFYAGLRELSAVLSTWISELIVGQIVSITWECLLSLLRAAFRASDFGHPLKQVTWSTVWWPHAGWLAEETQTALSLPVRTKVCSRVLLCTALTYHLIWLMNRRSCPGIGVECHSFSEMWGKAVLRWGLNLAGCPVALLCEYIQTPVLWVELCCGLSR